MGAPLGFKTFATGDVLTAADTNGYLMQGVWTFASATARDAAVTSPQEGNMCYLKDTDAVQYYSGSAWTAVGAASSFVGCSLSKSADQSTTTATTTTITFDTELFDTSSFHDNATNNSRITVPAGKAGYYLLIAKASFNSNATGFRDLQMYKNTTNISVNTQTITAAGEDQYVTNAFTVYGAVGDYFEIKTYQTSGGALGVRGTAIKTIFSAQYLGA